jgi:hypothetical protein
MGFSQLTASGWPDASERPSRRPRNSYWILVARRNVMLSNGSWNDHRAMSPTGTVCINCAISSSVR